MAKKKSDSEVAPIESADAQILKDHGEVLLSVDQFLAKSKRVVSISPAWDWATGGGIPEGSWVVFNGPSKSTKTLTVFQILANAQQQLGMKALFVPVEGRAKNRDFTNAHNLDTSPEKFQIVFSTEDNILSAEKQLEIVDTKMRTEKNLIIFIDSFSVLMEESRHTEFGKSTRGQLGQLISTFCARNAHVVPLRNHIIIGVTHTIANTGNGMATRSEKMPSGLSYQHDIKANLVWPFKDPWMKGDDQVGIKANWVIETHGAKVPINRKFSSRCLFNYGISAEAELMDFGIDLGVIEKSGAWYKYRKDGEVVLQGQGWEGFFEKLGEPENKTIFEDIRKQVMESL